MKTKQKALRSDKPLGQRIAADMRKHWILYLMLLPAIVYYIIFMYGPMYGAIIAFEQYKPNLGIWGSRWVGLKHFTNFMTNPYFWSLLKNTVWISVSTLIFGFPAPILLALLINELKSKSFARVTQTITYMPHFISLVVICGMIKNFTLDTGVVNNFLSIISGGSWTPVTMLSNPKYFVPIYVISDIWQGIGWGSIIYLSALAGIDQQLYEAATIDGAGRWRQTLHVTIPGIMPMIIIMLVLRMGSMLSVGYEKIILLDNDGIRSVSDVISTYVYRRGIKGEGGTGQWSYTTAVGLFNAVINFVLIVTSNKFSRSLTETSLW